MEESQNKNSQNRSSELPEQLQLYQSNEHSSFNYNKQNSSPKNNLSSPHSKHSNIKEENMQSKELSNHSPRSKNNDSLGDHILDNEKQNDEDANSASTNISDVDIISDVSGEIIPKSKLLKLFREEHNNKIKKTKKILRDADYRHAQYGSRKKSRRSNPRTNSGSNPVLDSNKAILNSIPESIKQSPGILVGSNNTNPDDLNIKTKSVSIGSLNDQDNNDNGKANSQKSNENNSDNKKSPKSNRSFSSHTSKFANDKLSPTQQQGNNSLENIASYNSSSHSEELSQHKHHKHHSSKRRPKRPQLVLSPVQCNNFFSNSNNPIQTRSINNNNPNLSPSDGPNFQFTPPSKLNSNGSKVKNDAKGAKKLETHFSSNLMPNSSIDFETVNAAPDELPSSSSFVTEPAFNGSSHHAIEKGSRHQSKDSSLSEVSMNFTTEPLYFSQAEEFSTANNSGIYNNSKNKRNSPDSRSKNSHVSIKSNSIVGKSREASHKSNSIIERNVPNLIDSVDESKLYTYTYETINVSDSRSWTYMTFYDYEYEEDEVNSQNSENKQPSLNENLRTREIVLDKNNYSKSDNHQSQSVTKESENGQSSKHQSLSGIKYNENSHSSRHQSLSGIKDNENSHSSKHKSLSSIKDNENSHSSKRQSLSSSKEIEDKNDRSSKHQSLSGMKESFNDRSSKHQNLSGNKESDSSRSPRKEKHQQSHSTDKEIENDRIERSNGSLNSRKGKSFGSLKNSSPIPNHISSSFENPKILSEASNSPKSTPTKSDSIKERSISVDLTPSPRIEEMKYSLQRELQKYRSSPRNLSSSGSENTSPRSRHINLTDSDKKESDFHFEKETKNNNNNLSSNVSSNQSFTEIFDKCHSELNSSSVNVVIVKNSPNDGQIHLSSCDVSHISQSEDDEDPNSIRNISQIPEDKMKRALPNPSRDEILYLSENFDENHQKQQQQEDHKIEQSLSLASSESASHYSSSSQKQENSMKKSKLVLNKANISREIRSFSVHDIDNIIEEEEEENESDSENSNKQQQQQQKSNSNSSAIVPRKIDFATNSNSSNSSSNTKKNNSKKNNSLSSNKNESLSANKNNSISSNKNDSFSSKQSDSISSNKNESFSSNKNNSFSSLEQKSSPKRRKEVVEEPNKKLSFPAFNLPSNLSSTANHNSHSFESLGRMILDEDDEEGRNKRNNSISSSSLFNSISSSSFSLPFNTLRVTIVEAQTQEEESDIDVQMFISSDRKNVASTEISEEKKNRHVFRETFNVSLEDLNENSAIYRQDDKVLGDLCILLRQKKKVIARTVIPISLKIFKIDKKVDRWYQLVPNGKIRIIAVAVDQLNRSFSSNKSSGLNFNMNMNGNFLNEIDNDIENSNSSQIRMKNENENKSLKRSQKLNSDSNNGDDEGIDEIDINFEVDIEKENLKKDVQNRKNSAENASEVDNDDYNNSSVSEEFNHEEIEKKIPRVSNFKPFNHEEVSDEEDYDNENSQSFADTLASVLN